MGNRGWFDAQRIWHTLALPNQGVDHLPGDWQPARRPDLACHSKIENTVRYLGIDVEYALALAENTEI